MFLVCFVSLLMLLFVTLCFNDQCFLAFELIQRGQRLFNSEISVRIEIRERSNSGGSAL